MFLDQATFRSVVAATPLVSIDLVVQNAEGKILLGHRVNRPAQNFWFVPGGRVLKNETLDLAYERLTQAELGIYFARNKATFMGVYEHLYADSIFGSSLDTHYVVLGYHIAIPADVQFNLPKHQHSDFRWWSVAEILSSDVVHENIHAYLLGLPQTGHMSKKL